jgi:hypothetical protein
LRTAPHARFARDIVHEIGRFRPRCRSDFARRSFIRDSLSRRISARTIGYVGSNERLERITLRALADTT